MLKTQLFLLLFFCFFFLFVCSCCCCYRVLYLKKFIIEGHLDHIVSVECTCVVWPISCIPVLRGTAQHSTIQYSYSYSKCFMRHTKASWNMEWFFCIRICKVFTVFFLFFFFFCFLFFFWSVYVRRSAINTIVWFFVVGFVKKKNFFVGFFFVVFFFFFLLYFFVKFNIFLRCNFYLPIYISFIVCFCIAFEFHKTIVAVLRGVFLF